MLPVIPAIQSFFEQFNYWTTLFSNTWSYVHSAYTYVTTGVQILYDFFTILPPYLSFFTLITVAYYVVTFVIHPE